MKSETAVIVLATSNLYRAAWAELVSHQPNLQLWAQVGNSAEVSHIENIPTEAVVLVDHTPLEPGFIRQLAATNPNLGLLCLVERYELSHIVSLLQAGASGFLERNAAVPDLSRALIATGRGEIVLPPALAARALAALARGELRERPSVESLTERETEVLGHLAQGMTNKDIAQTLFLSVRTVEAHLRNIYGKLQVHNRTEAVLWAVEHGYGT